MGAGSATAGHPRHGRRGAHAVRQDDSEEIRAERPEGAWHDATGAW